MSIKLLTVISRLFFVISFLAFFVGCGGSSGGGGGGSKVESAATVSGLAAAGPILGGTVNVYALSAEGIKGLLLGTTITSKDNGTYAVNIGSYEGNILVEVTGGTYKDEATQGTVDNTLIRAALTGVSGGDVTLAITPLTELAVQLATTLNTAAINRSNTLVSCMIGVNIIGVLPVDITNEEASKAASAEQDTYGLMLATISQMSIGGSQENTITALKNDLTDWQLDAMGSSINSNLATFIASTNNKSGVSIDTLEDTSLYKAIEYITNNQIQIVQVDNINELNKAKRFVTDLRNTVLSIYNYQGVGADGIMNIPITKLAAEIETKSTPELANKMDIIQKVFSALPDLNLNLIPINGSVETDILGDDGLYLTLTITKITTSEIIFVLNYSNTYQIGTGTMEVDNINQPTSGSLDAVFNSPSSGGTTTINADFTATSTGVNTYSSLTLTGNLKMQNESGPLLEMDFSQTGRGLSATFAPLPNGVEGVSAIGFGNTYTVNSYPTSVSFTGLAKLGTAQLTASIEATNIVYVGGEVPIRPGAVSITGMFEELLNGSATGTKFTGTIYGTWDNAATFIFYEDDTDVEEVTENNWPQWTATFSGTIEAPSRPVITATLKATQNAWDSLVFDVNFTRTNTDNSVVFISGTGTYKTETNITTGDLSNQDGLKINFSYDADVDEIDNLGTIKSAGGATQANLRVTKGAPFVKFIDNYIESLF